MHIILLKSDNDREKDMKNRKIFKAVSIVLCFLLISVSFTACQAVRNKFYKGAKKHLEDKYDIEREGEHPSLFFLTLHMDFFGKKTIIYLEEKANKLLNIYRAIR